MSGSVSMRLMQGENDYDDFHSIFETPYFKKMKKCGVNFEDVFTTLISGALLPGKMPEEEIMQKLFAAYGNDVTQPRCTTDDTMNLVRLSEDFVKCTEINSFLDKTAMIGDNLDRIGKECAPISSKYMLSMVDYLFQSSMDDDSGGIEIPSMEETNQCFDSIFGTENMIGNIIRRLYEHPKVFCDCTQEYAAQVPDCTVEEEGVIISLGMIKNSGCVIGVDCEQYQEHCKVENTALDDCLPDFEAVEFDCTEVMNKCVGKGSVFSMVPSILSTTIPDICQNDITPEVTERFTAFQQRCKEKKEYFTFEFNKEFKEGVAKQTSAFLTMGKSSSKSKETTEKVSEESTSEKDESSSSFHMIGLSGAFVLIAGTAFIIVRKKYYDDRKEFTRLSTSGFDNSSSA